MSFPCLFLYIICKSFFSFFFGLSILCAILRTFCAPFCRHSARLIFDRGFATLSARCKAFFGFLLPHGTSLLQHGSSSLACFWAAFSLFWLLWATFLACFSSLWPALPCFGLLFFGPFFASQWHAFFRPVWSASAPPGPLLAQFLALLWLFFWPALAFFLGWR